MIPYDRFDNLATPPGGRGRIAGLLAVLMCWLAAAGPISAGDFGDASPARFPALIDSVRLAPPLQFCGENVPIEQFPVRERMEKEMLLILWNRPQVILWLKRAGRYMPHLEKMLGEAGLPDDLKYLPVIESALRPHASSSKGAVGFWQFIRGTARQHGLTVNPRRDERRNLLLATPAAIRYLKKLHAMFDSWALAAAAYNMGEKGLQTEIKAQETHDYYRLYLSLETQRYVFRILAAKQILSQPENYGFHLQPGDRYPRLTYDRVSLATDRELSLQLVARAAETDFKEIKELNPELRGHYLPAGKHRILVPPGRGRGFDDRLLALKNTRPGKMKERVYVVRKGDSLTAIAARFKVPLPSLLLWNRLRLRDTIHPGDRLIIYNGKISGLRRSHDAIPIFCG